MMMELLRNPQAELAAQTLLHFLWQGTLLGITALVVLRALRDGEPRARYGAACLFLLAMALCPPATYFYLSQGGAAAGLSAQPFAAGPAVVRFTQTTAPDTPWFALVLTVWSAGVIVFSLRVLGGWALAAWRLSTRRKPAGDAVTEAVRRLAAGLGIRRVVRVYESTVAAFPSVFGALRPVIVLPASVITGLPAAQLEAILAHELAHIARHDFLVNCLQTAAEVLLFYHPAVWWLSRTIRQEREMCCDSIAAEVCGDRIAYSRALLALEESRQQFALAATGGDLKSRIEALLHGSKPALPGLAAIVPLVGLAGVAAFMLGAQTPGSPYEKWLNEDVVYLITPEERTAFTALRDDAERERFIDQFWLRRDPTPGTHEFAGLIWPHLMA